eukprot:1159358-Pelagomonas_calceolata.AAC.8
MESWSCTPGEREHKHKLWDAHEAGQWQQECAHLSSFSLLMWAAHEAGHWQQECVDMRLRPLWLLSCFCLLHRLFSALVNLNAHAYLRNLCSDGSKSLCSLQTQCPPGCSFPAVAPCIAFVILPSPEGKKAPHVH